ncbi:MAG TPA: efflux RND transporter periplasmic adaptor subunit [Gemmatimonadaceae bacterium]|nr:efflux RND transporter periplasmic adaptor subunit [Gemmatimonadaceae bacterium]
MPHTRTTSFQPSSRFMLAGASAAALLVAGSVACSKGGPPPTPPPSQVSVLTVTPRTVEDNLEFTGQVRAYRSVQVRAQANGVIIARPFTEGAQVHVGEVLYRIDPTTADAEWRSAKARLASAQATLANTQTMASRLRALLPGNAVAKQDVDNAEAQVKSASAAVDDARGSVDAAQKNLSETTVRAQIDGRIERTLLDVGARVTGPADLLTTIDVLDPIYVTFRPSTDQQAQWRSDPVYARAIAPGGSARVQVTLPDGSLFPTEGRIGYIDPVVDPQTGTQEYRAQFANPRRIMLPGQFVHVALRGLSRTNAIVIPQRAVLQQMGRQSVYVVGPDNKVAAREVKATTWTGNDWLIESGLAAGDRVVVDGVQKIGPGAPVQPTPYVDSASTARADSGSKPAGTRTATPSAPVKDSAR